MRIKWIIKKRIALLSPKKARIGAARVLEVIAHVQGQVTKFGEQRLVDRQRDGNGAVYGDLICAIFDFFVILFILIFLKCSMMKEF